jgi:hypothetical protein
MIIMTIDIVYRRLRAAEHLVLAGLAIDSFLNETMLSRTATAYSNGIVP